MQVKKQQLELDMEQQAGSKLGKSILSPCLFNVNTEYIMWNPRLAEAQAGVKVARRNISNLRYADDTTIMAESEEERKRLNKGEREEWKSWLKTQHSENEDHDIRSHHFMGNRWETVETVSEYFLGAPKLLQMVIAAMKLKDACSLEEKLWPT